MYVIKNKCTPSFVFVLTYGEEIKNGNLGGVPLGPWPRLDWFGRNRSLLAFRCLSCSSLNISSGQLHGKLHQLCCGWPWCSAAYPWGRYNGADFVYLHDYFHYFQTRIHSSGVEDLICYVRPIFFFLRRKVQITFELQFRFRSGSEKWLGYMFICTKKNRLCFQLETEV